MSNKFLDAYIELYIKSFRRVDQSHFIVEIPWPNVSEYNVDVEFQECRRYLCQQAIDVVIKESSVVEQCLTIVYKDGDDNQQNHMCYSIGSLPALFDLAQQTGLSSLCLVTMRVVANIICRRNVLYKAVVLDLDDTLWEGALSEEGTNGIIKKLTSYSGCSYIAFMRFIKSIAEELGIYIAICTRNDSNIVQSFLKEIDENIFPIKNQIDLIVSNKNDKSENIRSIAKQLSILPNAIVFIDDNQIIRDEVRNNIPEVCVPDWRAHDELVTMLIACCFFERTELSVSSKNRKKQFRVIQEERKNNTLPELYIRAFEDKDHIEAMKLYAKSNQFKLTNFNNGFSEDSVSLYFEIYRKNGESLGVCSAITFFCCENECVILNWAISCRYFEIGLEEFVMLYMHRRKSFKNISFIFQDTGLNQKVNDLINKYYGVIIADDCSSIPNDSNVFLDYYRDDAIKLHLLKTRDKIGSFRLYYLDNSERLVEEYTNLKILH